MRLFYTPPHARVGDVIPFYEKGLFKPFYLKNWNAYWAEDRTDGWHMMTTTDHLHYCEQATGIKGGTGSVIKHDGVYHLFYCVFTHKPERQYICHAVSEDMQTWKPLPEETFAPDDSIYQLTDWRDPFVFYNEEEKCWWMLVCTQEKGVTARQGCVGLCTSDDLHHWTCQQPIYAPHASMSAYECPDMFFMNGWWYLVFSQFTDRFATCYRMSRSPRGPWIRPQVDTFDARAFYAAKTGTDGVHRYLYGWNPSKTQNTWGFNPDQYPGYDYNTWDWGGSMIVHELWQREDGTLAVKPVPALSQALTVRNDVRWKPMNGSWQVSEAGLAVQTPGVYAEILSRNEVPETAELKFTFSFTEGTQRVGLALQVDEDFANGYYFYFDPKRQRVEFKGPLRMFEQGGWTFPFDVELERPLSLKPNQTYQVRLFVDETVMCLYVNDEVALTTRGYDLHNRSFALVVDDGSAKFSPVQLTTPPAQKG